MLREENCKLAKDITECREGILVEIEQRSHAEEQLRQLKETNAELERRIQNQSVTTAYFNPRLSKILKLVEELKGEMPFEEIVPSLAVLA